jgi:hypothetical protein
VIQAENEPAWSLLQRLAALHGYGSTNQFCRHHELELWDMTLESSVRSLADMAAVDADALVKYSPIRSGDTHFEIGKERVQWAGTNPALFKLKKVLICPQCVLQDQTATDGRLENRSYYRTWWNFPSLTNCPIHDVQMVSESPRTGKLLNSEDPDPKTAGTDLDLTEVFSIPANADFERYIVGRLGYLKERQNDLLDTLTLSEAIAFVLRAGFTLVEGRQTSMPAKVKTATLRVWNAAGWKYLHKGTKGFISLLDHLVETSPRKNGYANIDQAFGKFYLWILQEQRFGADRYVGVVEQWAPYVKEAFPTTEANGALRQRDDRPRTMSNSAAAADLGISRPKLRKLIRGSRLIKSRGNSQPILTIEQVEQLRAYLGALVYAPDIVRDFGIARRTLNTLVELKILKPDIRFGTGDELAFEPETVSKWWERITQGAPTVTECNLDLIPLVRTKQEVQVGIETSALMLYKDRLKCHGLLEGVPKFQSILVSKEELRDHILPDREKYYDREQAQKVIGAAKDSLLQLVEHGYLDEYKFEQAIGTKRKLNRYDRIQVDKFATKFISRLEANKLLKRINPRGTAATFGIRPSIEFSDRNATSFYDQSEIRVALGTK